MDALLAGARISRLEYFRAKGENRLESEKKRQAQLLKESMTDHPKRAPVEGDYSWVTMTLRETRGL